MGGIPQTPTRHNPCNSPPKKTFPNTPPPPPVFTYVHWLNLPASSDRRTKEHAHIHHRRRRGVHGTRPATIAPRLSRGLCRFGASMPRCRRRRPGDLLEALSQSRMAAPPKRTRLPRPCRLTLAADLRSQSLRPRSAPPSISLDDATHPSLAETPPPPNPAPSKYFSQPTTTPSSTP